ncbi:hypothetical protein BJ322DRAFT_1104361 [Thelephora terrestris]|uniref:RNB domain-containing protein n=1 Tax=Thelephora terrestris TaxID=56493 RepID=A0A9P6HP22_9AGAM|nr:hypothetical protein BJ322DRAFT_1104361 [Thelephora terrestris]
MDVDGDELFDTDVADQISPKGSFLEVRRANAVLHAVALGPHYSGRTQQVLTLTTTGEALAFNHSDIMLCIPDFLPEKLADACGLLRLHSSQTELVARTRVLERLRSADAKIELAVRYVDNRAARFYHYLKSDNPHQWRKVDVNMAAKFYDRPGNTCTPMAIKIAVHKHLMDHPRNFVAHPTAYRATQTFLVRPSAQVKNIFEVTEWMRVDGGRVLDEFCDRVKVVLEQVKALRQQSTLTTPHEIQTNYKCTITDTDREILRFLLDAYHIQRLTQFNPHSLPTSYILKRLGVLDDTQWPVNILGPLQQLLTDLGVFTPWTDSVSIAAHIECLAHQPVVKPIRAPAYPRQPLGPEDFYKSDPLEALRHDFGYLPVYVIDDPSASELDDGISIEPIENQPDNHWVHVHVADPTALLPPTHILADRARELSESSYSAHGINQMLPRSKFERFSLGHTAANKEPQQVMTYSFKVDRAGDLIDYKVQAAIVKNIHILTYDAVDAALGLPSVSPTYPFKLPDLSLPSHRPIETRHTERLRLLLEVSSRMIANRARLPIFSFSLPSSEIRFANPIPAHLPSPSQQADLSTLRDLKLYNGFPDMMYFVNSPESSTRGSRAMISEFMKAACRVASRFGVETGTPLVRRHGAEPFGPDAAAIKKLIASRDDYGIVDEYEAARCSVSLPRSVNTLTPKCHWSMGIPDGEGYVRVTSPLRRYADLVAHWQIKQALLAMSDPARYPKGKRTVFGEEWLTQYARELTFRDRERKRMNLVSREYWTGKFIKRWLDGEIKSETLDPKTAVFEARPGAMVVREQGGNHRMRSMVTQLGLWGDITQDDALEVGSRVKVRIASVQMGARPKIKLQAV